VKTLTLLLLAAAGAAAQPSDGSYLLKAGTRIPLSVLNTVSTKNAQPGDQVYLQTIIPVFIERRLVIPAGSHVLATITHSTRPGKVKGKGELYLRFDSILLDNGVTLGLAGRIGSIDGGNPGTLSREEGKLESDSGAARDAVVVGGTAVAGTGMGHWIGDTGSSAGIGAAAGAAAGLGAVLLTRGPDSVLQRGSTIEMVLDRDLRIADDELPAQGSRSLTRPAIPPNPHPNKSMQLRAPGLRHIAGWF
jgi:hypothetical protein